MELRILRNRFSKERTGGQLYIDGDFFCFTLEDTVREIEGKPVEEWKVQNETAIPYGRYKITLENSAKFGPDTISLANVPGFKYIRMHTGNTEKDTEGCILVGYKLTEDNIIKYGTTRPALLDLKARIKNVLEGNGTCWIEIKKM